MAVHRRNRDMANSTISPIVMADSPNQRPSWPPMSDIRFCDWKTDVKLWIKEWRKEITNSTTLINSWNDNHPYSTQYITSIYQQNGRFCVFWNRIRLFYQKTVFMTLHVSFELILTIFVKRLTTQSMVQGLHPIRSDLPAHRTVYRKTHTLL